MTKSMLEVAKKLSEGLKKQSSVDSVNDAIHEIESALSDKNLRTLPLRRKGRYALRLVREIAEDVGNIGEQRVRTTRNVARNKWRKIMHEKVAYGYDAILPMGAGIAVGYSSGRNLAGHSANVVAPRGHKTKAQDVARSIATLSTVVGGIGGIVASRSSAARLALAKVLHKAKVDGALRESIHEYGAPLVGAIAGGSAAGVGTGLATGVVAHALPGGGSRDKLAGVPFLDQDRPAKVKEIYSALLRDHPEMPAALKARIAARKGKANAKSRKSPKHGGPKYKAPITHKRVGRGDGARYVGVTKKQRAEDAKYQEKVARDTNKSSVGKQYPIKPMGSKDDPWKPSTAAILTGSEYALLGALGAAMFSDTNSSKIMDEIADRERQLRRKTPIDLASEIRSTTMREEFLKKVRAASPIPPEKQKVADKIKKVWALANDSGAGESSSARAKALRMLQEHGLNEGQVFGKAPDLSKAVDSAVRSIVKTEMARRILRAKLPKMVGWGVGMGGLGAYLGYAAQEESIKRMKANKERMNAKRS